MPAKSWFVAIWLAGAAAPLGAADEFPYTAYVALEGAEVVAGPGHRYYATEHLPRGTPVEVYREEASGWLAIRPPDSSFSWVPAKSVERAPDDRSAGRVTGPTPAWVGTSVEHVGEHRQQVTLKEGELLQIIGEKEVAADGAEKEVWLKIAPPAGEFRWIHLRDVSRQAPPPALPEPEPEVDEQPQRPEPAEPRRLDVAGPPIALADIERPKSRQLALVERAQFQNSGPLSNPLSPDGFVPRKRTGSEHLQPPAVPPAGLTRTSTPTIRSRLASESRRESAAPAPVSASGGAGDLAAQLERLELDLSLMVAKDKTLWDLASIKTRVRDLVDHGPDPAGRGRARLLLDKVEQFEQAFAVQNYGPIRTGATAAAAKSKPASPGMEDPRYDAQGWLKPVISRQGDKPVAPYAVVDQDGQPLCFITPQPGMNLRRYENKQVGVYGRRGFLEELKKPHVTARQFIDLDIQWR